MDISEKLLKIDKNYIYAATIIVLILPQLFPLGLPLEVTEETSLLFNYIEQLQSGDLVVIHSYLVPAIYPELEAAIVAVLNHLFSIPDIDILFISTEPIAMGQMLMVTEIIPNVETASKEYGMEWVVLPWIPGVESGMASLAKDLHFTVNEDYFGTPLEDLPMMEQIGSAFDWDLVIEVSGGHTIRVINQFNIPYKTPVGVISQSGTFSDNMPYLKAGMVVGLTKGVRGGAEYELLLKKIGDGAAYMDSLTLGYTLIIFLIIVKNVSNLYIKIRKGKVV